MFNKETIVVIGTIMVKKNLKVALTNIIILLFLCSSCGSFRPLMLVPVCVGGRDV